MILRVINRQPVDDAYLERLVNDVLIQALAHAPPPPRGTATQALFAGHDHFALVGHDRVALVAIRAGLEHPRAITHLACLDVLPTLDMWDILRGASAAVAFHLYLMAQPPGLPETMISASAGIDLEHDTLDRTAGRQLTMPATVIQQDWAAALGFDAQGIWRSSAPNLEHHTTSAGHFMAEEAPSEVTTAIRALLQR